MGRPLLAAGLALAPAIALAQQATPPASAPADSVGPRVLQNFSLGGTVTRPADGPVAQPSPPPAAKPRAEASAPIEAAPRPPARSAAAATPAPKHVRTAAAAPPPESSSPPTPARATPAAATTGIVAATPAAAPNFAPDPQVPGAPAPAHSYPLLLWLFEALVLLLAGALLFWRTRGRELFAGSARFDLFTHPEPEPEPAPAPPPTPSSELSPAPRSAPAPVPRPAQGLAAPATSGVVSTSLRPWMDIGFQPVRCVVDDQRVVVEFDLELFNSGSAPARAVLVEVNLFNAGADQDAQIGAFFANPVGKGERIAVIPPLKRLAVRSQAVALREQIQVYELAGRPAFVPIIAFNLLYGWSGGEGQTSVGQLLGRETGSEKLGPFHLDLGPHIFRNVGARLLPIGIRR